MTGEVGAALRKHLLRADGQEDLCFATWRSSRGSTRETAIINSMILPQAGERNVHGNASFNPGYFLRSLRVAAEAGAGLAFLHSHPLGAGSQGMSHDDVAAEQGHAAQALVATGHPLLGLTLAGDHAWSARVWVKAAPRQYEALWGDSVRVVGPQLSVTFNPRTMPPPRSSGRLARTVSAWGDRVQSELARLHIGVIGAGSVGSMVAEALARLGIVRLTLMDFDSVKVHNLDRCLHATAADVGQAKVQVLARGLRTSSTAEAPEIRAYELSVVEEDGFRTALDCDVLFSCVDRPWARYVLNVIAYAHLIPVVDGGIQVSASPRGLRGAHWRAHVAGPGRQCLECLEQYDPGLVQMEREGRLDDPKYIDGLPDGHVLKSNENVFPFSMNVASLEVLQFIRMVVAPSGIADVGGDDYQFAIGRHVRDERECRPGCWFVDRYTAQGEDIGFVVTGQHEVAARSRKERRSDSR